MRGGIEPGPSTCAECGVFLSSQSDCPVCARVHARGNGFSRTATPAGVSALPVSRVSREAQRYAAPTLNPRLVAPTWSEQLPYAAPNGVAAGQSESTPNLLRPPEIRELPRSRITKMPAAAPGSKDLLRPSIAGASRDYAFSGEYPIASARSATVMQPPLEYTPSQRIEGRCLSGGHLHSPPIYADGPTGGVLRQMWNEPGDRVPQSSSTIRTLPASPRHSEREDARVDYDMARRLHQQLSGVQADAPGRDDDFRRPLAPFLASPPESGARSVSPFAGDASVLDLKCQSLERSLRQERQLSAQLRKRLAEAEAEKASGNDSVSNAAGTIHELEQALEAERLVGSQFRLRQEAAQRTEAELRKRLAEKEEAAQRSETDLRKRLALKEEEQLAKLRAESSRAAEDAAVIASLQQDLDAERLDGAQLRAQLGAAERQLARLQEQVTTQRAEALKAAEVAADLASVQHDLDAERLAGAQLRAQLDAAQQQLVQLQESANASAKVAAASNISNETDRRSLEAERLAGSQLRAQLDLAQSQLAELQEQLAKRQQEHSAALADAARLDSLQQELDAERLAGAQLRAHLDLAQQQLAQSQEESAEVSDRTNLKGFVLRSTSSEFTGELPREPGNADEMPNVWQDVEEPDASELRRRLAAAEAEIASLTASAASAAASLPVTNGTYGGSLPRAPTASSLPLRAQLGGPLSRRIFAAVKDPDSLREAVRSAATELQVEEGDVVMHARSEQGLTLLHVGLEDGNASTMTYIVEQCHAWAERMKFKINLEMERLSWQLGTFVNSVDESGRTVLSKLCERPTGEYQELAMEVIKAHGDLRSRDREGQTPFIVCVRHANLGLIKVLLQITRGAILEDMDDVWRTPLHWAAKSGNDKVVDVLLQLGACVDAVSKDGLTPAEEAFAEGHLPLARRLFGLQEGEATEGDPHEATGGDPDEEEDEDGGVAV